MMMTMIVIITAMIVLFGLSILRELIIFKVPDAAVEVVVDVCIRKGNRLQQRILELLRDRDIIVLQLFGFLCLGLRILERHILLLDGALLCLLDLVHDNALSLMV